MLKWTKQPLGSPRLQFAVLKGNILCSGSHKILGEFQKMCFNILFFSSLFSFKWHNQLEMSYDLEVLLYHTLSLASYPEMWELKYFCNVWLRRKKLEKEMERMEETNFLNILFGSIPLAASRVLL